MPKLWPHSWARDKPVFFAFVGTGPVPAFASRHRMFLPRNPCDDAKTFSPLDGAIFSTKMILSRVLVSRFCVKSPPRKLWLPTVTGPGKVVLTLRVDTRTNRILVCSL